jgi:hypothetical protein
VTEEKDMSKSQLGALTVFTFALLGAALALEGRITPEEREAPPRSGVEGFRRVLEVGLPAGAKVAVAHFSAPADRRLVLEFAHARVAGRGVKARLVTQGSGEDVLEHRLGLAVGSKPGTLEAVQPLRAFADAGSLVTLVLERTDGAGGAEASVTLHGYAVEVP